MIRLPIAFTWVAVAVLVLGSLPFEDGPLGVLSILAPYVALAALALVPVVVVARSRRLALPLLVLAIVFAGRFGTEWWSFPPAAVDEEGSGGAPTTIDVITWNVEAGVAAGPAVVEMLNRHPVDLVAIEELTPHVAAAIEADPRLTDRYPYMTLRPSDDVSGIGLLSRFPMSDPSFQSPPIRLETTIDMDGRSIVVIAAHPFHADISTTAGFPSGLRTGDRNHDLELLRERVAELDARGEDVLLLGDFNTALTEPAFSRLTSGLRDAHAEVGVGPGWTWRPARFSFLGIGLLRIDLVLSTAALAPQRIAVDCPAVGDHCLVEATLAR